MNLLIFQNPYEFFHFFFTFMKRPFLKKNRDYNRAIVSPIPQKILSRDMEFWYKHISKIRKVMFIFQNFQRKLQKRKKTWKNHMDSKNSINLFEIKRR